MSEWAVFVADGLVLLGSLGLTLSIAGLFRLPSAAAKVHALSAASLAGVLPILAAAAWVGDGPLTARAVLTAVVMLLTAPIAAHTLVRLARRSTSHAAGPRPARRRGRIERAPSKRSANRSP